MKSQDKVCRTKYPAFFTIDVEDYYHIIGVGGTPPISEWDGLASRVETGLNRLFELCADAKVRGTFFFLGYLARRFPNLVHEAIDLGHEVASHGMYHQEVRTMSADQFLSDARDSRLLLEDIAGRGVRGWRSAGFSVSGSTPWFFDKLLEAGYCYDSSIVQSPGRNGGLFQSDNEPGMITTTTGRICEFPVTMAELGRLKINMFGGGYLRLYPSRLVLQMARRTLNHKPLLIYIHPRELDPGHPRIRMNLYRRFKSYINLKSVPRKLGLLLELADFQTLGHYYDELLASQ